MADGPRPLSALVAIRGMINTIRWICVIPASYLGYYIALIGGMLVYMVAESFCPPDAITYGICTSNYMRKIEKIIFVVFPCIAAILVVLLPTLAAATKKAAVALTFFVGGSSVAIYLGASLHEWVALSAALACGGVTMLSVFAHQNRRQNA